MSTTGRTPLSVVIITLDEVRQLPSCIESVRGLADEILVVDSGSTDGTQKMAREAGARVVEEPWRGFGQQKQFAVEHASHNWVLCLDSDERVTPELRDSIQSALSRPHGLAGFRFARCNKFMGSYLRYGEGYPDWSLRLFDRRLGRWSEDAVHEKVILDGPSEQLKGDLLHDSAESLHRYVEKQNYYSTLAAEQAARSGKRASAVALVLSPLARFLKFYVFRRGFVDGVPGLVHILVGCFASFMKHAKLMAARDVQS